jgi:putative transposase
VNGHQPAVGLLQPNNLLRQSSKAEVLVMQLTFRVRACPTKRQHAMFADDLAHTQRLYNAALEERIHVYNQSTQRTGKGRTVNKYEQSRELTVLRREAPEYARVPRRMQRWTLNLLDAAYQGMFTRAKKLKEKQGKGAGPGGEAVVKLGQPRFRSRDNWNTIGFDSPIDFEMRKRGLHHRKAFGGTLRLKPDRELPPWEKCTALTLHRDGDRWFAHLTYEMPDVAPKPVPTRPVGIDINLKKDRFVARSDKVDMDVPRQDKGDTAELRRLNRKMNAWKPTRKRKTVGSKRSKRRQRVRARLRRLHAKIARKRQAQLHKISARLTHHFDAVAVEDLNIAGLNQGGGGGAKGRGVRKSWRDRAPGKLVQMLDWKCQRDGRPFVKVDPRYTTINCSSCGAAVPKTLRDRTHRCECGAVLDRDHNAALNILARAGWGPGIANPGVRLAASAAAGAGLVLKHGKDGRTTSGQNYRPRSITPRGAHTTR